MVELLHCPPLSDLSPCRAASLPRCLQVFGVTLDPFIVYTSNMFAILSLRGLYGFVSGVMGQLRHLDKAVSATRPARLP